MVSAMKAASCSWPLWSDGLHRRRGRPGRIAFPTRAGKRLAWPAAVAGADDRRIALDDLVGAAQDGRRGAAIGRHGDALDALRAEGLQELIEGVAGGAAKLVDGLIGIADGEDVGFARRPAGWPA